MVEEGAEEGACLGLGLLFLVGLLLGLTVEGEVGARLGEGEASEGEWMAWSEEGSQVGERFSCSGSEVLRGPWRDGWMDFRGEGVCGLLGRVLIVDSATRIPGHALDQTVTGGLEKWSQGMR